jgi:hypothetical protein
MAHFEDLFPGRFVKSVTLEHPITIRILSIAGDPTLSEEDGKPKVVLRYRTKSAAGEVTEMDAVWNKTNSILTAAALDTNDYTQWPGHTITIARDPTVKIGKEVVGGLRVVGSPELKAKKIVEIKRRKGRERYTLNPTDAQGRVRTAPPPAAAPGPARSQPRSVPPRPLDRPRSAPSAGPCSMARTWPRRTRARRRGHDRPDAGPVAGVAGGDGRGDGGAVDARAQPARP